MKLKELLKNKIKLLTLCIILAGIITIVFISVLNRSDSKTISFEFGKGEGYNQAVQEMVFDIACHAISGDAFFNKSEEYPFADSVKSILNHYHAKNGSEKLLIELYYPEYEGIIESLAYYNPYEEKAGWVEESLVRAEEERIALELKAMEESLEEHESEQDDFAEAEITTATESEEAVTNADGSSEDAAPAEEKSESLNTQNISKKALEIEEALEKEFDGKLMTDSKSNLRFLEDKKSILIPMTNEDGYSLIQATDSFVIRRFYNSNYRILKKESWKIDSANVTEPESSEVYTYAEDGITLASKLIDSGKDFTSVKYNEKGLTKSIEKYVIHKKKKYTIQKRECSYNDEDKIVSDEVIDYVYTDENYKKIKYTFSKKYIYEYNEGDIPPDYKYYENDVLKMHNKYSVEKGNYTSHIYFDDNLSVKAYYEDYIHVRDVYYRSGNIIREKVYEQNEQSE